MAANGTEKGMSNNAYNGSTHNIEMKFTNTRVGNSVSQFNEGSTLSAHDINYSVSVSGGKCKSSVDKQILYNVTGIFKPGMTAIMGPTGSGKSSFLDVLAGRKDMSRVEGQLLLDGRAVPDNFKCMVGYVVQDDVVMGTLTIRENFAFSAALRLPTSIKPKEKQERVEQVIKELGLTKCADTKVGNEFIRGVSGGERKRCNIGMELIISPPVLFLDEPTTGLDANTANSVLGLLRRMSRRGRTIIFSIHQPRFTIYQMFDNIMLLSRGCTVYHGPAQEALNFFASQGFQCQEHNNPPDFFLDVINGDPLALGGPEIKEDKEEVIVENDEEYVPMHDKLVDGFKVSNWYSRLMNEANGIYSQFEQEGKGAKTIKINYATSYIHQCGVLAGRSIRNIIRNPQTSVITIGTSLFFAVIISAIFWQASKTKTAGFADRSGVLFFMLMNQMFLNMPAVEVFINERKLFMHENVSGFYRASVYFFVKIFCDILPLRILPVGILCLITFFTVDLRQGVDHFFMFAFTLFCVTMAASSLCFLYSSLFRVFAVAQLVLALSFVLMMLLGGFMIRLDSIGVWLNWAQYLSIMKFGLTALYQNEFRDVVFCNDANGTDCMSGNQYLINSDMEYAEPFDFWVNHMALLIMTVAFLLLTYLRLRFMKKTM